MSLLRLFDLCCRLSVRHQCIRSHPGYLLFVQTNGNARVAFLAFILSLISPLCLSESDKSGSVCVGAGVQAAIYDYTEATAFKAYQRKGSISALMHKCDQTSVSGKSSFLVSFPEQPAPSKQRISGYVRDNFQALEKEGIDIEDAQFKGDKLHFVYSSTIHQRKGMATYRPCAGRSATTGQSAEVEKGRAPHFTEL